MPFAILPLTANACDETPSPDPPFDEGPLADALPELLFDEETFDPDVAEPDDEPPANEMVAEPLVVFADAAEPVAGIPANKPVVPAADAEAAFCLANSFSCCMCSL